MRHLLALKATHIDSMLFLSRLKAILQKFAYNKKVIIKAIKERKAI